MTGAVPPTAAHLAALGVHDPSAPYAPQQLQLLEYLISLGATTEDLVAYRDELPGLAAVVAVRGGGALTLSEMVERTGVSEEKLLRIIRAAVLRNPQPRQQEVVIANHVKQRIAYPNRSEQVWTHMLSRKVF